ncbi:MAG: aspartate aminotransferase family protein [Chitinophagales bacterium]|nr:MAG: aspartate aminotransferase family protein [Chitinophagales bacterium]
MDHRHLFFRHLAQTSPSPLQLEFERAEGLYLITPSGEKYLDLISGIAVSYLGHAHPGVMEALRQQMDKHLHLMVYGELIQQPQVMLAAMLAQLLPSSLEQVYFTNSGSEAVEGAMKLAKKFTGRPEVACFHKAYHGSTQGALSLIGSDAMRQPFLPLLPGIKRLEFNSSDALHYIDISTACVIVEPVQAEAGVRVATKEFISALRARCTDTGALLVFDEAQTAFGRTGKLFAFEQYGVTPDILILAKGLGGGLPLGAFIASEEIMQVLSDNPPLGHITTFGGHPLSCAAGAAALTVLLDSGLTDSVAAKEKCFRQLLSHRVIQEVRSAGLLIAVEFDSAQTCRKVIQACIGQGILTDWFLFAENCMRIAPPLIIDEEKIADASRRMIRAIEKAVS